MKLSIIVPVYNMASDNKLTFCLDSLINQTIDDYEIIAVDDASTDNSLEILKEYKEKYPDKFSYIESPVNTHQGGAKNKGIKAAKGDWIGFIDSDDWISPNYYETMLKKAEETGADMVGCDFSLVSEHSFEVGTIQANGREDQSGVLDTAKKRSLVLDGGSLCVKIYRRERIINDGLWFPENIFYEDNAVGNSYLVMANHYEYMKLPMYYYYQHSTSTVHTVDMNRCEDRMQASRLMLKEAIKRGYYDEVKEELDYKFIILFYLNTVFSYVRGTSFPKLSFVKKIGREFIEILPDYENNKYFKERINEEEKKMIKLQLKNTCGFVIYYKMLWAYRKLRYGKEAN
ncbi:MAG: glycosyltransferase [Lachnospiraceae bacterium]|nr:glycosyltransferase [Lachnospiraceae bacterium]